MRKSDKEEIDIKVLYEKINNIDRNVSALSSSLANHLSEYNKNIAELKNIVGALCERTDILKYFVLGSTMLGVAALVGVVVK